MRIIGISGKKQAGKSFLAKNLAGIIQYQYCGAERIPIPVETKILQIADALKQVVIDCFIPPDLLIDDWPITCPNDLDSDTVKGHLLPCGKTIRYLLQQVGTEMFRGLWPDVWINAWKRQIMESRRGFVICPDVRFPNELKAIHDLGGMVIRLTRAPFADVDQHESEIALDGAKLRQRCTRCNSEGYCERYDRGAPFDGPCNICNGDRVINKGGFDFIMDNKDFSINDARRWANDFVAKNYSEYV